MDKQAAKLKARELLSEGKPVDEVVAQTKLDQLTVKKQLGWLKSPYGTAYIERRKKKTLAAPQAPSEAPTEAGGTKDERTLHGVQRRARGNGGSAQELLVSDPAMTEALQRELLIAGTPLLRKIVLNPKVYLWHDYAKAQLGFKGDIGDFVLDCVDDFFEARGFSIVIERKEAVSVR